MDSIHPNRTLADLVTEDEARVGVLEALGLDFCCGGDRTLEEACRAAGLDVRTVGLLLARPPSAGSGREPKPDLQAMSLTALADHIEAAHHGYLRDALPRLSMLASRVVAAHGANHGELHEVEQTLEELAVEIGMHLDKEEQVLFPAIRALEATRGAPSFHCGHLSSPIAVMEREHEQAGRLLAGLRERTRGYVPPQDACATYRTFLAELEFLERDLHRHIHKENYVLFPRALKLAGGKEADEAGFCAG